MSEAGWPVGVGNGAIGRQALDVVFSVSVGCLPLKLPIAYVG